MVLTAEDIINKRFQQTKFREGYDQDEVDDFLDEVVAEIRRLNAEIDRLREEGEQRGAVEEQPTGSTSAPSPQQSASVVDITHENAGSLLSLAQRLHDEHIAEGISEKERLIAEGKATAEQATKDADMKAKQLIAEAEANEREINIRLYSSKNKLEAKIKELQSFETNYRKSVRVHLERLLEELKTVAISDEATSE